NHAPKYQIFGLFSTYLVIFLPKIYSNYLNGKELRLFEERLIRVIYATRHYYLRSSKDFGHYLDQVPWFLWVNLPVILFLGYWVWKRRVQLVEN
ncbi:MAG: hypothetical protein RLZZ546_2576, partial [Bacteroidota bacterium]